MNSIVRIIWNLIFNLTGLDISFGANYRDWEFFLIELRADYQGVKKKLAERGYTPHKIGPGETRIQIVGCDMRDVQMVGPYFEVSIQVPIEPLDGSTHETFAHLYLPVTTEAARWPGVEITGFPKFLTRIALKNTGRKIFWRLMGDDSTILEFEMDDSIGNEKSLRWEYYGNRKGQIIKTIFDLKGKIYEGEGTNNPRLVLGEHPISEELRKLILSENVLRIIIGHDVSGILRKPVRVEMKEKAS
jgi:hypothetical protein